MTTTLASFYSVQVIRYEGPITKYGGWGHDDDSPDYSGQNFNKGQHRSGLIVSISWRKTRLKYRKKFLKRNFFWLEKICKQFYRQETCLN